MTDYAYPSRLEQLAALLRGARALPRLLPALILLMATIVAFIVALAVLLVVLAAFLAVAGVPVILAAVATLVLGFLWPRGGAVLRDALWRAADHVGEGVFSFFDRALDGLDWLLDRADERLDRALS